MIDIKLLIEEPNGDAKEMKEDIKEIKDVFGDKDAKLMAVNHQFFFTNEMEGDMIDIKLLIEEPNGNKKEKKHGVKGGDKHHHTKTCGHVKYIMFHDKNDKHMEHMDIAIPPDLNPAGGVVSIAMTKNETTGECFVSLLDGNGDQIAMDLVAPPKKKAKNAKKH